MCLLKLPSAGGDYGVEPERRAGASSPVTDPRRTGGGASWGRYPPAWQLGDLVPPPPGRRALQPEADISHCRLHFCEYSAVASFVRCSKEFEQLLMLLGEIQHQRPLPWDEEPVNPHNIVKDPPCGGVLYRCALLVRDGAPVVLEGMAHAIRQRRIHEPAHRHHPQERHAPLGLFEIPRRGAKAWLLAEANAAFRMPLALVAREQRRRRELGSVQCVGGQEETTLAVDESLTGRDP